MSIYTKSKTTVSNLDVVKDFATDDSFKVGIAQGAENIIIDYLTNLYANPTTAVVRELFTNACDATGAEGDVTIQIEETGEDSGKYRFTITDYGCGMSAKQLKENYITYAASTKLNDFDSVGSFGLGSKSPMAIVPSYTVVSCDGEEQNKCIVARTGEGIFANIEKIESMAPVSFTKVSFEGFSRSIAQKMDRYIRNVVVPFSKVKVNYENTIFTSGGYEDSPLLKNKSFKHSFKILRNAYEITLYGNGAKDFYKMWNNRFVEHYVRVNNIVYYVSAEGKESEDANSAIVIDVEPGYFAFAPSREDLPRGEKFDHIKDILTGKLWDSYDEFIKWAIENEVVTPKEAYEHEKKSLFTKINDAKCFIGLGQDEIDSINFLVERRSYDNDFNDVEGLHIYSYKNSNSTWGRKTPELTEPPVAYINDLLRACINSFGKKNKNSYNKTIIKTTVVEGVKKGRKSGQIHIPSEFKKMAVGNRMYDKKCELQTHWYFDRFEYVYIFVEEGVELPKNVKKCLNYCSLNSKWEVLDAEYVTANYGVAAASNGKPKRARVSVEDRSIRFRTSLNFNSDSCKLSELPEKIGSAEDTIIAYDDITSYPFVRLIASITGKKVAAINDMTKGVYKYLSNLGYEIFNARAKRPTRVTYDCRSIVGNHYDMLDNPNEFTMELIETIVELGFSEWAYFWNKGFWTANGLIYKTDFEITKKMHAKIRYNFDASFKEDCDKLKKYLAPDYEDIDSYDDKAVNIICANIDDSAYHAFSKCNETISPIDVIDVDKFIEDNKEDIVKCKANGIISSQLFRIDPNHVIPRYQLAFEGTAINNMTKFIGAGEYSKIADKACEDDNEVIEGVKKALSKLAENNDFKKYSPIYDDLEEDNELDTLIKAKVDEAINGMTKKLDSIC